MNLLQFILDLKEDVKGSPQIPLNKAPKVLVDQAAAQAICQAIIEAESILRDYSNKYPERGVEIPFNEMRLVRSARRWLDRVGELPEELRA